MWKFYCYDDGKNPDLWARWYADASDDDRAAHDQTLDVLVKQPVFQDPPAAPLKKGLVEIKFKSDVQWRILGFYYPKKVRRVFTILMICCHKQKRYYPHQDSLKIARKLMRDIEAGKEKARESARPN